MDTDAQLVKAGPSKWQSSPESLEASICRMNDVIELVLLWKPYGCEPTVTSVNGCGL